MLISRKKIRRLAKDGAQFPTDSVRPVPRPRPEAVTIRNLPKLDAGDLFECAPDGNSLVVASGCTLQRFRISGTGSALTAEPLCKVELPGQVAAVFFAPDGALYVRVAEKQESLIAVISDGEHSAVHVVQRLPDGVVDAVATRRHIVSVVAGAGAGAHRLLVASRRNGRVVREEPLSSARVQLRAGRHDEVMIVDRGTGQLRLVNAARTSNSCAPSGGSGRPGGAPDTPSGGASGDASDPKPHACRFCACAPCCCRPHRTLCIPGTPGADGSTHGSGSQNPSRDPDGQCVPGDDGDPDGCLVTTYIGAMVVIINVCEPAVRPCTARLDRDIGSLRQTRNAVFTTSADGSRINVLERATLRMLHEQRSRRGVIASLHVARDADVAFLVDRDGAVALFNPGPALPSAALDPVFQAPGTQAVFLGSAPGVEFRSGNIRRGKRRVLMVAALEPGQSFSPTGNVASFGTWYQVEEIMQRAQDFYLESTRHWPPDNEGLEIEFVWFGMDTPDLYTGPPIELPNPFKFYWGDPWDPGHVRGVVPLAAGGLSISFSGDEQLTLNAIPSPEDTYDSHVFNLRFPAASYAARIPDALPTIMLGTGPVRQIDVTGTDRQGNMFGITVNTNALPAPVEIDLTRATLASNAGGGELDKLAGAIETLLDSAPGLSGLFERPQVLWHDDGKDAGMLHVALSFASAAGGTEPQVTMFNMGGLLTGLGGGSIAATFALPGDESTLAVYLWRSVADAVVSHPEFGSDLSKSYLELFEDKWTPSVSTDSNELAVRLSLSTKHGRKPAIIKVDSQTGLAKIGMDAPQEVPGLDTKFSGGGGPMLAKNAIFDDAWTGMIDKTVGAAGNETFGIAVFNSFFNSIGTSPGDYSQNAIDALVLTPVYITFNGAGSDPDLVNGERGNANSHNAKDTKASERVAPVLPFGGTRPTIVLKINPQNIPSSAGTLAHELGHGIVGLPDLYDSAGYREGLEYVGGHCIMGDSGSLAHFCAFNQRIRGWLEDDAILLLDRPTGGETIERDVVLIQLEYWDPLLTLAQRAALAQAAVPGMADGTPVVAAIFLRLGGGHLYDVVELRGKGAVFSQGIDPSRVLITNALDVDDDTRYGEDEMEGGGTSRGVLERYRRRVHKMTSSLQAAGDIYNFAESSEFPEVGLSVEILEWGSGSNSLGTFDVIRLHVTWNQGDFIDLGFKDNLPDWQSPDIAVIKPEDIDDDGNFTFPEGQNAPDEETYRIPSDPDEELMHKIAVRVWNFGNAPALNVEVALLQKRPGGAGDWSDVIEQKVVLPDPLLPSASADPAVVAFDWAVGSGYALHACFRAIIGDRDVERDATGHALASDLTSYNHNWAQQNVFEFESVASSPPAPVEFTYQVQNEGSYLEEVSLLPRGLGEGSKVTISPAKMRIAPFSRGVFRVKVELEEWLLNARCGKDIAFVMEARRFDDHGDERWGAAKYVIKPRLRSETTLDGTIMPDKLSLHGMVSPDVGAQKVLLHIQRPGQPSIWDDVTLGPNATFEYELEGSFPPNIVVNATAYYDGSFEYAKSVSEPVKLKWIMAG